MLGRSEKARWRFDLAAVQALISEPRMLLIIVSAAERTVARSAWITGPFVTVTYDGDFVMTYRGMSLPRLRSKPAPDAYAYRGQAQNIESKTSYADAVRVAGDLGCVADKRLLVGVINPLPDADATKTSGNQGPVGPSGGNAGKQRAARNPSQSVPPVKVFSNAGKGHGRTSPRRKPNVKAK